ncbi:MAG: tRNA (5-methylaminomethyl-2-thiouridine)(34)-methyltransferase MnmD [Gammaproteobacteria bacterium]|nr:tRNA (5-methylaminomethyl-2-thiouridine)(34)-methyltransferase MnmD [Gammaproteobacteria bacterium]
MSSNRSNTVKAVSEVIAPARLGWRDEQPYCEEFRDIYHASDGPAEVARVFIEPSGLAARAAAQSELLIGELGFGTGLNFVVAADAALHRQARVHFVSFDAAPIAAADFTRIGAARCHDHALYAELATLYPPLISGWHRRYLAGGRITLSLFWGDAAAGLDDIRERQQRPFDAWFLDGFAPDRNPGMWSPELLSRVGALSAEGSTVATFTAAGRVRRALEAAGFSMRRIDQRPHKRESLAGTHRGPARSKFALPGEVSVVGAGLAGASAARHLAERGVRVSVFEAAPTPAAGASGIPATVLHPRLLADGSTQAALRCHAYLYSDPYSNALLPDSGKASPAGALQMPGKTASATRLEQIAARYSPSGDWITLLTPAEAAAMAGWEISAPALWFPGSRVIDTPRLCRTLLDHPAIEVRCENPISAMTSYPTVLACGVECRRFAAAEYLETAPVQGQVDVLRMTSPPTLPLLGNGYLVPRDDDVLAGSTYEYEPWDPAAATVANLAQLGEDSGGWEWLSRARATRCVSSDRTPIAGRLYDAQREPIPGAYVSTGHGSMGNVFCHFAGALVAAQLCGEFAPMTTALETAMCSLRFRERQARRGSRHSPKLD